MTRMETENMTLKLMMKLVRTMGDIEKTKNRTGYHRGGDVGPRE